MSSWRRFPLGVRVLALLGLALFLFPLAGLVSRASPAAVSAVLDGGIVFEAARVSIVSSVLATVMSVVLGVPLAIVLARSDFRGRNLVRGIVTLPMVLPPVVGGAALLFAFGRRGLFGSALEQGTGLVLPFSIWGVVIANAFVAMPFLVITVESALRALDPRYETVAATLGARPWKVLRRVTLPMIRPSLIGGLVLTWARALGEFGATITFAGNLAGRTRTLPLAVYVALESDRDAAVAISLLMVGVSLAVLVALRDRWWGLR